jgi:hypothetical protein
LDPVSTHVRDGVFAADAVFGELINGVSSNQACSSGWIAGAGLTAVDEGGEAVMLVVSG